MAENKPITSYSLIDQEIPSQAQERRATPRTHLEVDLTITFEGQEFQGMTHNLSRTGIFVSTYRLLPLGAVVRLKLALPNGGVIATGMVARVRSSSDGVTAGMGVAFDKLDELDRGLIEDYCVGGQVRRTSDIRISSPRSSR